MKFEIVARSAHSAGRAGIFHTPHGPIETPAFMPVGTLATIKALLPADLANLGAQCVLANAYHLAERPGAALVGRLGGLHAFMGWNRPILTDSGGYQVFSLGSPSVDDWGVTFTSHRDGRARRLTPRRVVRIQELLGADLIMPLDVCLGYPSTREQAMRALEVTHRWLGESVRARRRRDQALFAIVQGGMDPDLRLRAARTLAEQGHPGYAIGGLSVGEPRGMTDDLVALCAGELPDDRPRYLMGVGEPDQLSRYAHLGIDLFDCVLPTRLARTGVVFSAEGKLDLAKVRFSDDRDPIDPSCRCETCQQYSRSYLHTLIRGRQVLAPRLLSIHNVAYLIRALREVRRSILEQRDPRRVARSTRGEPSTVAGGWPNPGAASR